MFPLIGIAAGLAARAAAPVLGKVVGGMAARAVGLPGAAKFASKVATPMIKGAGTYTAINSALGGNRSNQSGRMNQFNAAMNSGRNNQQENSEFIA
jgi:hypothetical protein